MTEGVGFATEGPRSGAEGEARMRSTGASTLGSNHSLSGAGLCPATEGVGFEPTWEKPAGFQDRCN